MPNRIRGEAALDTGGRSYRLLLTLGALAEIEDGLGLANLSEVAARLKTVRAADLAVVAAALLRGGGHELGPADVLRLPCDLGTLVAAVTSAFDAAGLAAPAEQGEGTAHPFAGANWLSLGLFTLKLSPQTFWQLSLPEWRALTTPPQRGQPLRRAELEEMLLQHPD